MMRTAFFSAIARFQTAEATEPASEAIPGGWTIKARRRTCSTAAYLASNAAARFSASSARGTRNSASCSSRSPTQPRRISGETQLQQILFDCLLVCYMGGEGFACDGAGVCVSTRCLVRRQRSAASSAPRPPPPAPCTHTHTLARARQQHSLGWQARALKARAAAAAEPLPHLCRRSCGRAVGKGERCCVRGGTARAAAAAAASSFAAPPQGSHQGPVRPDHQLLDVVLNKLYQSQLRQWRETVVVRAS